MADSFGSQPEHWMLEIIASLWRENSSRDLKTEPFARVLELCSRSESWSWSSV